MKKRWNIKAKLAGGLAAVMVFTMTAPGLDAYASGRERVNKGDPVSLTFDPGDGPGLELTSFKSIVPPEHAGQKIIIEGKAGDMLSDTGNLAKLDKPDPGKDNAFWQSTNDGLRMLVPSYELPEGSEWGAHYHFDGFYDNDNRPVLTLDPRVQYNPPYIYTSRWSVIPTATYEYKVMYYRDLDTDRGNKLPTDEGAWPDFSKPDADQNIRSLRKNYWPVGKRAINTATTIPFDSDIPGYKLKDMLIKNNVSKNYYGVVLPDPDHRKGIYPSADYKTANGYMPNSNMSVAFRYVPDETKTYPVTLRYVDESGNPIKANDSSRKYQVEQSELLSPATDIPGYHVINVALTKGDDINDLDGTGIFTATSAGSRIAGETGSGKPNQFQLVMPNQPVEVTFTYKADVDPVTNVTVSYCYKTADGSLLPIPGVEPDHIGPIAEGGVPVTIPVKEIGGYQYSYYNPAPDVKFTPSPDNKNITFEFNGKSGALAIVYVQNDDPDYWGTISFGFDGTKGNIAMPAGKETVKFKKADGITVGDAVKEVTHSANAHYTWDGWYHAASGENKPTGSKLDAATKLTESTKLFANFVEDGSWYDITFASGPNGKIGSSGKIHTNSTLTPNWSYLTVPTVKADSGYIFDCWADEAGNRVTPPDPSTGYPGIDIRASQKYTATFRPLGINPDGALAKPNAVGSIGSDGQGQILVKGANNNRKYVLTDSDGIILETENGSWLAVNKFFKAKLNPCARYEVFEVSYSVEDSSLKPGVNLPDTVEGSKLSYPAAAVVPTLGSNYKVENDGTDGTMKITVNPAAPDSMYAVLDVDGQIISDLTGSDGGWVTPSGGTAALRGLEEKNLYTVIAKRAGESVSPEDLAAMGSQISIPNSTQVQDAYSVELLNGGFVDKVNGEGAGGVSKLSVHKGDVVTINAEDPGGRDFKKWNVIIGSEKLLKNPNQQSQNIKITNSNVVLQPEFEPSPASSSDAVIAFHTNNGSVGLDMSQEQQEELKRTLTNNTDDQEVFKKGSQVTYTVNFDRRTPMASESNALKKGDHGVVDSSAKIPWALTLGLTRQVGSSNQPLPSDPGFNRNAPVWVYGNIDRSVQGYSDYHLFEAEPDGSFEEITMEPDPNTDPYLDLYSDEGSSDFTGLFRFSGKLGYTYFMSYMEAYRVTVMNNKKGGSVAISVPPDTLLSDTPEYQRLDKDPITGTDGGLIWEYAGLSKKENSQTGKFDPDHTAINRNMTLYVLYDDTKWQAAKGQLNGELSRAKTLIDDPSIKESDKAKLQADIDLIQPAGDDHHTLSVNQLDDAYRYLKAQVDAVINGNQPEPPPTPPEPPTPPTPPSPPKPDNPGGGGSSGGGGGGGSSSGGGDYTQKEHEIVPPGPAHSGVGPGYDFNNYKTYRSGTDGTWSQAVADGSKWNFILPDSGKVINQWINISYNDLRGTSTYHFDTEGVMNYGWYIDETGKSYFMDPVQGTNYGRLTLGWYQDPVTQTWYYFNQFDGSMMTGWQQIGDSWYYLSPDTLAGHAKGTLYTSTTTPDGYQVDADGRWIKGTK